MAYDTVSKPRWGPVFERRELDAGRERQPAHGPPGALLNLRKLVRRSPDARGARSRQRAIRVSSLIVWGRHAAFGPAAEKQALRERIGSAQFVEYADAGQAMKWSESQRFARDIHQFVTSVASTAAAA
jgi:pimeloyl-ACP methyl ester carboxylesterase